MCVHSGEDTVTESKGSKGARKLGVAGLQLLKTEDGVANLERFETVARKTKVSFPWVDLIFTGEYYLQQYGKQDWKDTAEELPNQLTDRLGELAKGLGCWLVPGTVFEKEGSEVYNTALVYNPEGEIAAKYRKIFPWMPFEDTSWGTDFVTFDIPDVGRIGLVICYDIWFPELLRTLTWKGAGAVLYPSLTYTSDRASELVLAQAHAIMYQCYILNVNAVSLQGGGMSIWVDPEGQILEKTGTHEAVMTNVIDFDRVDWVRQNGHMALDQVWKAIRDSPLKGKFPPYENLGEGEVFEKLGKLKVQKSVREWKD
jgi:predicted amidohydrolase